MERATTTTTVIIGCEFSHHYVSVGKCPLYDRKALMNEQIPWNRRTEGKLMGE